MNKTKHFKLKIFIILVLLFIATIVAITYFRNVENNLYQEQIQSFYETSGITPKGKPGELIRTQEIPTNLVNGQASRILYRTQKADGENTFSSGLVFVPSKPSLTKRKVLAWAHGTIGMGDKCAPSRNENIANSPMMGWVDQMLSRGWVVVATDYAGLGTPGNEAYLIGEAESNDVLNSVRALNDLKNSNIGKDYAIWGHSQGGHSALFSASRAKNYLPEFNLVGVVASAPAAQLKSLFMQQYETSAGWVIGSEVAVSWPDNYSDLSLQGALTKEALNNYKSIANQCINEAALEGILRDKLGQKFFQQNFINNQSWLKAIDNQTAPVLSKDIPLMVAESLTDKVVLPNTTAEYIQRACASGSNLDSMWLTDVGHIQLQTVISPSVINWVGDRFAGKQNYSTCNQPLPITPSSS